MKKRKCEKKRVNKRKTKIIMGGKMDKKLIHICEVCGKTKILTPEEAFNEGWDYPPRMGSFGIVSPRTCGNCPIYLTVWWALVSEKKNISELSYKQRCCFAH